MRFFNSTAAFVVLLLALFALGFENLLLVAAIAAVAGVAFAAAFRKKTVIALDAGGVITEGDFLTERLRERKGMRGIVQKLRKNYRVVLLTNQNALAFRALDKDLHLSGMFDDSIVSGEIGVKKPDKGIFNYILKRFNILPNELVFVDDSAENVEAARKAGIRGIQFSSISQLVADLGRAGVKV